MNDTYQYPNEKTRPTYMLKIHLYIHLTCIHTVSYKQHHMHKYICTYIHTYIHTYIQAYINTNVTNIHLYSIYIHIYIYTHTYIHQPSSLQEYRSRPQSSKGLCVHWKLILSALCFRFKYFRILLCMYVCMYVCMKVCMYA